MNIQELVPNAGTSAAPSFVNLTTTGDGITGDFSYLAWKGESGGDSSNIWWTSVQNNSVDASGQFGWPTPGICLNVKTSDSPALASFNGMPYMAWKGAGSDPSIYFGNLNNNVTPQGMGANSSNAPAIVGTDKALIMAWKGETGDSRLFWARSADGKTWKTHNAFQWGTKVAGTSSTPALTNCGSTVYMVWKGATDNTLWWSKYTDQTQVWSEQTMIPSSSSGLTSTGPAVYCNNGKITVAWKGISDSKIYFSTMVDDGKNKWSAQTVRYSAETSDRPALFNYPLSSGNPMLFWKGNGTGIYYGLLNLPAQNYGLYLDSFDIINLRSGNGFGKTTDTDHVSFSMSINGSKPQSLYAFMGDCQGGATYQTGLAFPSIKLLDTDRVSFSYYILNHGGGSNIQTYVESVTEKLATTYFTAAATAVVVDGATAAVGALIGAAIGSAIPVPLIGAAIGALVGWLVGSGWGVVFANCDGPVAAAVHSYTGADLRALCAESNDLFKTAENNPGVNSSSGCLNNSNYDVTWSATVLLS